MYRRSDVQDVIEISAPNRGAHYKRWTPEEDKIIRQHYIEDQAAIISLLPGCNWTGIVRRAHRSGIFIKKIRLQDESWRRVETRLAKMLQWAPEEDNVVRDENAGEIIAEEVLLRTGRTAAALPK